MPDGADLDGSYLDYAIHPWGTCCTWADPAAVALVIPYSDLIFHTLQVWEQELVPLYWTNTRDAWQWFLDSGYGSGSPLTRYYTRVYGRLRSILMSSTHIWATYHIVAVGWIEQNSGVVDVFGNPTPDDWNEEEGTFTSSVVQKVVFRAELPEDFDCDENFDVTLEAPADLTGTMADELGGACSLGLQEFTLFSQADPFDFTGATLRVRKTS